MKNVVIIGASHAAAEAISSLRKAGWQDKITLIGEESSLPYQRPPLSKAYYQGVVDKEKLLIKNEAFYQKMDVDLILGKRVELIDRKNKHVVLDDSFQLEYEKLILATGTSARCLPVKGESLAGVNYFRTMADVDAIKQKLVGGNKLLIVGAGYIGLEVAASAAKQGVQVTVLEAQGRVLARVTSPEVSDFFYNVHTQSGVDIRLNTSLEEFSASDGGGCFARLTNGEEINFDCAIVGIGVVPNVELAQQAGLDCDNGIVVDHFTRTKDPDIYAVGDCSNHPSVLYKRPIRLESVPNAIGQAKTAALSICGENKVYDQLPWFWSDQYDLKLQTAGLMEGYDRVLIDGDMEQKKFTVSYFKQEKLIAMDAVNSPAQFMKAKKQIVLDLSS